MFEQNLPASPERELAGRQLDGCGINGANSAHLHGKIMESGGPETAGEFA